MINFFFTVFSNKILKRVKSNNNIILQKDIFMETDNLKYYDKTDSQNPVVNLDENNFK